MREHIRNAVLVVPGQLALDRLGKADPGLPSERLQGLAGIERNHRYVIGGRRHDGNLLAAQLAKVIGDQIKDFLDRVRLAAGDIEHP
jgi:hypothetical protein